MASNCSPTKDYKFEHFNMMVNTIEFLIMANILLSLSIFFVVISHQCYKGAGFASFSKSKRQKKSIGIHSDTVAEMRLRPESDTTAGASHVFVSPLDGLRENDKIDRLPGQPENVDFNQYSGYVKVDSGKALFYYFVESPHNSSSKPLLLWTNGLPGCSSFGIGAFTEIGPFRVNRDGKILYLNPYAWNSEANVIFVEFPVGVGFSYSNTSSDYEHTGDYSIAYDMYTFLVNWLERFPEYKNRDFFIGGESYGGHYASQIGEMILHRKNYSNQTIINLKGVALGNAYIDYESSFYGSLDYAWTHAMISDEMHMGIRSECNISSSIVSDKCSKYFEEMNNVTKNVNPADIYAPLCNFTPELDPNSIFGPCSIINVLDYVRNLEVQRALHAHVATVPYPWKVCNDTVNMHWNDNIKTVLPIINELIESGIHVWIYSGDTDSYEPVTSAKYAINKLGLSVSTPWYPWYLHNEVGGYAVGYQNLTFVTLRGAGHFVSDTQPARVLALFSSFIKGKLPNPSSS